MKGVVFVALAEMIQGKYGHRTWNEIIEKSQVESAGVYTAAETYKDEEALQLLAVISEKLSARSDEVLSIFGIFLIKYFKKKYPQFFETNNFPDFLCSIDNIVHVEIKKLAPDSIPPKVLATIIDSNHITVVYFSKRKLCYLAKGLIKGASHIYGVNAEVEQTKCMHNGHEHCEFLIKIK
ncbi:MAG: heme NO-binding domain-containing protein [Bacteriovorax sp.]|nr:heme NO-binding domain-containing protein [Bacteriovorax sp.]